MPDPAVDGQDVDDKEEPAPVIKKPVPDADPKQLELEPGPGFSWVSIDLGRADLLGQVVTLQNGNMVGGSQALYSMGSDFICCMRRMDAALVDIVVCGQISN